MSPAQRRLRILFVLPNFGTGGSEKLVVDLIRNLDHSRFDPVLVVFFSGEREPAFRASGFPLYVIHAGGTRSKLQVALQLSRIVRAHRIDVVNTHHPSPLIQGLIPFRLLNRPKWIHTEHTRLELEPEIHDRARWMCARVLVSVDRCVGISAGVCEYVESALRVPRHKITKILNGVETDRFVLPQYDRAAFRGSLGVADTDVAVGMFANFRPQKNHRNLLRAVAELMERGLEGFRIYLCGTGPTQSECEALSSELGLERLVKFLGARHDIPELMNAMDIYCLPSRYEGLPLSLLEAMACGRPVVATNVVGNDEVVVNGENGLLCRNDDFRDLADKLQVLVRDASLREKLGAGGLRTAQQLSFTKMIQAYERLFEAVCVGTVSQEYGRS